jgi:hypothetical protein
LAVRAKALASVGLGVLRAMGARSRGSAMVHILTSVRRWRQHARWIAGEFYQTLSSGYIPAHTNIVHPTRLIAA